MAQFDLLHAIETPFAIVGLVLLLLSVLVYLSTRFMRDVRKIQARRMALVAIAFSFIITAMVTYQAMRQIANDRKYRGLQAVYSVRAFIKGTITSTTISEPLVFRVSSGQVNVGCNDSRETNAVWSIPEGATDVQQTLAWENTDNAKGLTQHIDPTPQRIIASGVITGLDRSVFGNCSGGGHGELVLKGTYRIARNESHGQQTLKTLDDKVNRGQPLIIAVPREKGITPESCDIDIQEGNRRESVHLDLQVNAAGTLSITNRSITNHSGDEIPVDISLDQDRIALRII